MTKTAKKPMHKNKPVQNYDLLKLALFLESLTTSKLRYYYLHHNDILIQNGKTAKKPSCGTAYQGLKIAFVYLKSDI